jgi:hypothetical protein
MLRYNTLSKIRLTRNRYANSVFRTKVSNIDFILYLFRWKKKPDEDRSIRERHGQLIMYHRFSDH